MTVTFYTFSGSPFVWRVALALAHRGVAHDVKRLDPGKGEHKADAYLAINPRGQVPALVEGDVSLYESAAIVEYIEDRSAEGPRLFPQDAAARARVRKLICEIDQYWWPAKQKVIANLYFKSPDDWDHAEIEEGKQLMLRELSFFEEQLRGDGLSGELGAADYALYPMLAHIARYELKKPDLGLGKAVGPGLRAMMARVEALPFFEATYPPHWR